MTAMTAVATMAWRGLGRGGPLGIYARETLAHGHGHGHGHGRRGIAQQRAERLVQRRWDSTKASNVVGGQGARGETTGEPLSAPTTTTTTTTMPARKRFRTIRFLLRHSVRIAGTVAIVAGGSLIGLFIYDSMTYHDKQTYQKVPISPIALTPEKGGAKNLPIAQILVDDEEDQEARDILTHRPKLVILGTGWGAVSMLKSLKKGDYHVTVVSPDNYFCFTPLLPSATVGTVEPRSLVEPIRKIISRLKAHFIQSRAVDVDFSAQLIELEGHDDKTGESSHFYLPYDKLVIAVGSTTNHHGVPGLDRCFQLKTVQDSLAIRKRILNNLEVASLPTTSDEVRKKLLSFVVCGGGPTGIEFASEVYDLLNEDLFSYFPKIMRNEVSVHVIQSRDHILNTYSEKISNFAESKFAQDEIDTILNARVKAIEENEIVYTTKDGAGGTIEHRLPYGLCLWSTGITLQPFTKRVTEILPRQHNLRALLVDSHLRVIGAPLGSVYAMGDASTVETNLVEHLQELAGMADTDKDGSINYLEWRKMVGKIKRKFPMAESHFQKLWDLFEKYDTDKSGTLEISELEAMFKDVSSKTTNLPATAQVASQQGIYLAKKMNRLAQVQSQLEDNEIRDGDIDDVYYTPFKFRNLGSLAYIGNAAAFDLNGWSFAGGLISMYLWRSVYWSEQVSLRTRALLAIDWIKRGIWGRDLSKF